mmetsp:Transcript_7855/g.18948  ORF Transcript_7855/g.18948 Transcript_7855/m.18948 type:complete len:107 (+) Transcript_7855:2642-2962(+)
MQKQTLSRTCMVQQQQDSLKLLIVSFQSKGSQVDEIRFPGGDEFRECFPGGGPLEYPPNTVAGGNVSAADVWYFANDRQSIRCLWPITNLLGMVPVGLPPKGFAAW